ncbi:hypothetical protein MMC25_002582 [Agyrium rufum]|nr:hypothetical protein [Agyrium rufum]
MEAGLRRKDTTKGLPLRVLTLDGGGVRGYSMLILLQELMYRAYVECEGKAPRREDIPKPCDYFDLIAGTGTGGLIAIMLGRLRLDLETCKDVYVRMTRRVFETDKTIAGIPYRSTLFKASKLEDALRETVREHTIFEDEGNDGTSRGGRESMIETPTSLKSEQEFKRQSVASSGGFSPVSQRSMMNAMRWGNSNASLYDSRENRTKTAVTAVYKGTSKTGSSILLRSYDARKEPPPEFNCSIWQAGRATAAIGLAFKPIQIGQSVFLDEGAGKYNPAPQVLDEAAVNEYPGREIGVFMSIGTGKRPSGTSRQQTEWWEGFMGGSMGDFAEARRRLMSKIEGCEETHEYMLKEHLAKRGVNTDAYYRLNVEVGVGEFGMNEWARLAEISTSTRRYISKPEVQKIIHDAGTKLARIERATRRQASISAASGGPRELDAYAMVSPNGVPPPSNPLAVELPGDDGPARPSYSRPDSDASLHPPRTYPVLSSMEDKFAVLSTDGHAPPTSAPTSAPMSDYPPSRRSNEIPPSHFAHSPHLSAISPTTSPRRSYDANARNEVPALPPKVPIPYPTDRHDRQPMWEHNAQSPHTPMYGARLPYPDSDGPPPVVNMSRKPEYTGR